MSVKYYEGKPDRHGEPPPPPGSKRMAAWLVRTPRPVVLTNTSDGSPAPFLDDGGKVEGDVIPESKEGQNRQLLRRASRRARTDKPFQGMPQFVSREEVLPAFPGDFLHTGPGGWIVKATPEHEKLIEMSKEARDKRIKDAREDGMHELAHLRVKPTGQADLAAQLTDALKAVAAGGEADAKLRAENEKLKAELAAAQATGGEKGKSGKAKVSS